jgi:Glucose-6-phosphate dehydrogenase, C-terminal domain
VTNQALRNAALAAAAANPEILPLEFLLGDDTFIWNRDHVDHIQITAAETAGVEGRGRFYETTGAQDSACKFGNSTVARRHRDVEESNAQPGRAALYRLRSQSRQSACESNLKRHGRQALVGEVRANDR